MLEKLAAPRGETLLALQNLRAVAALGVVAFHACSRAGYPLLVGQARVDVFFVISGFIMWILRDRGLSATRFITDRIFRIVPMYWLATTVMLVGAMFHLFPNLVVTTPHVVASYLFWPYPSPAHLSETWPLLVQGWTLQYEAFFYVLMTLTLFLPRNLQLGAICATLAALVGWGALMHPTGVAARFYTNSVMLEFAAGILICACASRRWLPGRGIAAAMVLAGIGALVAQAFYPIDIPRAYMWGLPVALIVAGAVAFEQSGVPFSIPPLLFIGNASFSIYLFHNFGISVAVRLIGDRLGFWPEVLLSIAIGTCFGIAAYFLVEKPLMGFIKARRRANRKEVPRAPPVISPAAPS